MRSRVAVRVSLILLCANSVMLGAFAYFAPRAFYDDYPFFAHLVERIPPYNEHLTSDVGGLYLGFAVVLAWAAWKLQPDLVRAVSAGFLALAGLHLLFHATHLEGFGEVDGIAEILALALLLVPPAVAFWASAPKS
jgi:hypothetical protein